MTFFFRNSETKRKPLFLIGMASTVLLLNLLVSGWIGHSLFKSRAQYQEAAANDSRNMALLLENNVEDVFGGVDLALKMVRDEAQKQRFSGRIKSEVLQAFLTSLRSHTPELDNLRIIDSTGNISYEFRPGEEPAYGVMEQDYFSRLRDYPQDGVVLSQPYTGHNGAWTIVAARRLNHPDGSFAGVAAATIDLNLFAKLFKSLYIGSKGSINLRDKNLRILLRYPSSSPAYDEASVDSVSEDLRRALQANGKIGTYVTVVPYDNVARTISYRHVEGWPLYVLAGVATDDYLAAWRKEVLNNTAVAAFFLLISLLVARILFKSWTARTRALEEIDRQQRKFRSLASMSSDWFWEQDSQLRFTDISWNPSQWSDMPVSSLIGKTCWDAMPEFEVASAQPESELAERRRIMESHQAFEDFEYGFLDQQGKRRILSISGEPIFDEAGRFLGYQGVGKDITKRKEAENRERMLVSMYRALSATNDTIIHAESELELFSRVCAIAVEHGGMMHAWVGVPDGNGMMVPVASNGGAEGFVSEITGTMETQPLNGNGPSGMAYREKRPAIVNDVDSDESVLPWREAAKRFGIMSAAGLPILRHNEAYAVLMVYSDCKGAFDDEMMRLLGEMAGNISFALDNFEREKVRRQSEIALRESERRFRMIADEAPFPLQIHAEDGEILRINRAWTTLSGYELADIPTIRTWLEKSIETRADEAAARIRLLYEGAARKDGGEYFIRCKGGGERVWHFFSSPLGRLPDGRRIVLSMAMDVTERRQAEIRETRLKNIYQALSATNDAIMHAESEQSLLPLVCRIAVEFGGMILSWVAIPDQGGRLVPVASYGKATGYLDDILITVNPDMPEGNGPSGIAFRENRAVVFHDINLDQRALPWRDQAMQYGIQSGAAFPVLRNGIPYAIWAVYSDQPGAFDEEIIRLMEEIAANIGFAIHNIERETLRSQNELALRESEARFRTLFESAGDGIVIGDKSGRIIDVNARAADMMGYPRSELLQLKVVDILVEDERHRVPESWVGWEPGSNAISEWTFLRKDGSTFQGEVNSQLLQDGRVMGVLRDISERKKSEQELKLAAMVYRDSNDGMIIANSDNQVIAVNPAFERITGFRSEETVGHFANQLFNGVHEADFYRTIDSAVAIKGYWKGELWSRRKNGQPYAIFMTINTSYNEDGSINKRVILFSDITRKKETDELLWSQANFDALTGLPNRNLFRDHLKQEIRKARRSNQLLALMFLDLDGFKDVNDTMGHDMGDLLLKQAAERLQGSVREIDTVARLGGDEFTVILTELQDAGNVNTIARNVLQKLAKPFRLGDEIAHVSASIGITMFPDDAVELEDLLKNADQAMYAAKQRGRNQYQYFTQSMQDAAQARMRLVNDLRGALENNQFEVVYQPIVELASGSIHKAEALIRWQHPARGMVNPAEFIPAAEDTGMINAFGDWVFHQAASQAAHWRKKYLPEFQISVNISPVQFKKEGIDSTVWFDHMKKLGLPAQGVVVEITEGLLLEASASVSNQLLALRDAGIEVALDDFGTGYSSLSYLKKFDIDYLKIDQTFVRNLAPGSSDMALCEAIIVMAHKLGLKVIAEGVETERQRNLLAAAGCDYAQGFLFSGPVSAQRLEEFLSANRFGLRGSV